MSDEPKPTVAESAPFGPKRHRRGYLAALVGSHLGGVALLFGGGMIGVLASDVFYDASPGPVFLGLAAGLWAGEVVGCWLGLRLRRQPAAITTAVLLALTLGTLISAPIYGEFGLPEMPWARILLLSAPLVARGIALLAWRCAPPGPVLP